MHNITRDSADSPATRAWDARRIQRPLLAVILPACVAMAALATAPARAQEQPLILATLETTDAVVEECTTWDVIPIPLLPQSGVDPYGNGAYETPAILESWLDRYIPADYDGYLAIDWRDGVTEPLLEGPEHPRFDPVLSEMVSVVDDIKRMRPSVRVGFVGLPVFDYWNQGDTWRNSVDAAARLYEVVDAFFPDVRDVYGTEPERDLERLGVCVAAALEIAGDRPVFLYTSHRYENVTERWGYRLIPRDEYVAHVSGLMAVEHDGVTPAGAVAAGRERHTFLSGASTRINGGFVRTDAEWQRVRDVFATEAEEGEAIDDYLTRLHPYILCLLNEAVRGEECRLDGPSAP